MTNDEYQALLKDSELRLDRLRSLYEQWFQGIERREPKEQREELERRVALFRRNPVRNTALRFRTQTLIQRYVSLQSYWARVSREIEEGTNFRSIQRAKRRSKEREALRREIAPTQQPFELDFGDMDDLDALVAALEADPSKRGSLAPPAASGPPPPLVRPRPTSRPSPRVSVAPRAPLSTPPKPAAPPPIPAAARPPAPRASAQAPDSKAAPAEPALEARAPRAQPAAQPAPEARFARPKTAPGQPAAPPATAPSAQSSAMAAPPVPAKPVVPPAARPPAAPAVAAPPAAQAKPVVPPPVAPAGPAAQAKPPQPPAPRPPGPTDDRIRAIYERYVEARRKNNERVDNLRLETVAASIQKMLPELAQKHRGKQIDFEIVVKDGRVGLKPVPKG